MAMENSSSFPFDSKMISFWKPKLGYLPRGFLMFLAISQDYSCSTNLLKTQEPEFLSYPWCFAFVNSSFVESQTREQRDSNFCVHRGSACNLWLFLTVRCNVKSVQNAHSTGESLSNSKLTSLLFEIVRENLLRCI